MSEDLNTTAASAPKQFVPYALLAAPKAVSDALAAEAAAVSDAVVAVPEIIPDAVATEPVSVPEVIVAMPVAAETVVTAAPVAVPVSKSNSAPGRAFRVKLRGSVLVLVRLPNKRLVRAAIHQLSTSGGVIHLEKPLDEKLEVEVIFHVREATIRGKAQMLFPMWATQGWMQPFRFVALPEESRAILDTKLKSFVGETAKAAAAGA